MSIVSATSYFLKRPILRCVALIALTAVSSQAHNLDTRATGIQFAQDFVQTMSQRAASRVPLVQVGDEFWITIKTTPGPGTTTGVGGYQTFYVPEGFQVIDAAYAQTSNTDPRGFIAVPMKGQSPIAIGAGPIGSNVGNGLTGFSYPAPNVLGINEAPVTAGGRARGTLAGVYADTGIFYSTDPRTAFNSYGAALSGGSLAMTNNSGDTVGEWNSLSAPGKLGVMTLWDSYQLRAFGRRDVSPIIDSGDGRGNAPWGMASAVAGPHSGYAWSFDFNDYSTTSGTTAQKVQAGVEVGPWKRVKYPGSQISKDQPGLSSSTLGYAGVDASNLGHDFATAGDLPAGSLSGDPERVYAIRFAIGQLEFGRPEYSAIKVRVLAPPSTDCTTMYADAFGGDAGGMDTGKDHLWRYFDPTVVSLTPCTFLQKRVANPLLAPGGTTYFDITFAHTGNLIFPNMILSDTLPTGLNFVSATPAATSVTGSNITWNIGTVSPGDMRTVRLYVKATGTGALTNTVTAISGGNMIAKAEEVVEVAARSLLRAVKTVTPSNAPPGANVQYTITVYNEGTAASGTPLILNDTLPAGFNYASFVSAKLNGATIASPTITVNATNTARPAFTIGQSIQPGKTLTVTFNATIGATVTAGTYYNLVEVNYEGKLIPPVPQAPVNVGGGQIGDVVFRDWNGDGTLDAGEEGISGVTVQLYDGTGTTLLSTTTTDVSGNYLFSGFAAGTYQVRITAPAEHFQTSDPDGTVDHRTNVTLTTNQIVLTADFGYKYDALSLNAASIGDFVYSDTNNNHSEDATEAGIPLVTVNLYEDGNGNGRIDSGDLLIASMPSADGITDDYDANTEIDPEGFYLFTGLDPARKYIVDVDGGDADVGTFFGMPYQQTTADQVAVGDLTPGDSFTKADFGFFGVPPASIGDQVFIDNNGDGVFNSGDTTLANIAVELYMDADDDDQAEPGELVTTQVTNVAGVYSFTSLGPSTYIVKVLSSDADLPAGSIGTVAQHVVTLTAGDTVTRADFPYVKNLTKSADKASALANESITYTMRPYHPGTTVLTNAVVTDHVPTGTTYNGNASPTPTTQPAIGAAGTVTWNLGSTMIAAGGAGATPAYTPTSQVVTGTATVVDTFIDANSPTATNGNNNANKTRPESGKTKASLIRFTMPSFASSDVIDKAHIRVRVSSARSSNHTIALHRIVTPTTWDEASASWSDPNGATAGDWLGSGGNFGAADYDPVAFGSFSAPYSTGQELIFDVTSLVRGWRDGSLVNNGIVLVATGTDPGDVSFYSSEGGSAGTTPGPRLNIGFSVTGNATNVSVLDQFGSTNYNNNNGSRIWFGNWFETGDDGLPSAGNVKISGGVLTFKDLLNLSIQRAVDLAGVSAASLSFNLSANTLDKTAKIIQVQASNNGGTSWTTLDSITRGTATGAKSYNLLSLLGSVNANTRIRFICTATSGKANSVSFDNVQVTYSTPTGGVTSTSLSADTALFTGTRNISVTMTAHSTAAEIVTPPANLTTTLAGGVSASKVSGPTPASAIVDTAGSSFTWVYQVSAGAGAGSIRFSGAPTGPSGFTFGSASSQSVLVTPPLTFQVKVDTPAPSSLIVNAATLSDSNGLNATATASTATAASIGDLVWQDTNGDGTYDADGGDNVLGTADDEPGISGMRIYADLDSDGIYDIGESFALTDSAGAYRIYGFSAGTYTARLDDTVFPSGYLPSTPTSNTTTLAPSQQYSDADFGLKPSPALIGDPGSSIGDTLWLDANENGIVDSGETLLSNVTVKLHYDADNSGTINIGDLLLTTTSTNASGIYTFDDLSSGNFLVDVDEADPDLPAGIELVSGGANAAGVHDVTLGNNIDYLTADFGYNFTGSIGNLLWYDTDGDGIQDETNYSGGPRPAPNGTVVLYADLNGNGHVDSGEPIVRTATTADGSLPYPLAPGQLAGQYLFENLPPGDYVAKVSEQEVPSPVSGMTSTMIVSTGESYGITLGTGLGESMSNMDADFGFIEAAKVEGHVFHDVNGNAVFDPSETPLNNITVRAHEPGADGILGTSDDVLAATTATDVKGEYGFILPPGDYRIVYDTAQIPPALSLPTTTLEYRITMLAGSETTGLDFGVDDDGRIGDTVFVDVDSSGTQNLGEPGLGGVTVELWNDANNDNAVEVSDQLLASAITNARGVYEFTGLAAGDYVVRVLTGTLPSAYSTTSTSVPLTESAMGSSTAGATISGGSHLLDRDFGYPPVVLTQSVGGTVYDDDGSGGGASGDGSQGGTEPGLAGVTVTAYLDTNGDSTPDQTFTTLTNAAGGYLFAGMPQGSHVLIVVSTSTLPSTAYGQTGDPDAVLNHETAITNLTADMTDQDFGYRAVLGSIAGTVVKDADGDGLAEAGESPVAGLNISLRYAGADGILSTSDDVVAGTLSDGSGDYLFAYLLPGLYQITKTNPATYLGEADRDGGNPDVIQLTLLAGDPVTGMGDEKVDQDFEIGTNSIGDHVWYDIDGDGVQDPGELPMPGVKVFIDFDNDGLLDLGEPYSTTNSGGFYTFTAVIPGTYAVTVDTATLPGATTQTGDPDSTLDDKTSVTIDFGDAITDVDFGYQTPAYTISGQVRDDYDEDGDLSDDDQPVPSVVVKLYTDTTGNGVFNDGTLIATTTTNHFGNYRFGDLPDGVYFVQEIDPVGSSSTADVQGLNDNLIHVRLSGSNNTGNDFLDAVRPSGYAYDVATGQIVGGGSIAVSGPGAVTTLMDGRTGQYSFITDGTPGRYTLTYTPPIGYIIDPARPVAGPALDPTGGPDPYVLGSNENPLNPGYLTSATPASNPYYLNFDLAGGDPFVIQNNIPLRLQVPRRYIYWKIITPGGGPNPGSNGDGDCYTDLVEYALNLNPGSGVQTTPAFRGVRNTLTGKLDVSFNRAAGSVQDVAYTLMGLRDPKDSPVGWTALSLVPSITNNGDGSETVTYADVESDPYFSGLSQGFVRLKLDLDENLDTQTDATASTPAYGWMRHTFATECVMTGHPYLKNKIFCGFVDAVVGSGLDVTTSAGGISIAAQFLPGREYFVEIYSGDHAGHRFEINEAASTAGSISLETSSSLNTLTSIPATLAGDKIVVREHYTLNDLFPTTQFAASVSMTTADRVMFSSGPNGAIHVYWLYANGGSPRWVLSGNASLNDEGGRLIGPAEGWFTHPKTTPQTVVWHGMVRANAFACPLAVGANFIGSAYPMGQSPATRGMTTANGFRGNRDPTQADSLLFWNGNTSTQAMAYFTHYLLSFGSLQQWTELNNASLLNENHILMFKPASGVIYKMRGPLPSYIMPPPWTP